MGDPTRKTGGHTKSNVLLLVGVLGIVGGLALLVYGLAPAKDLWDAVGPAFSGGPPPDDLSPRMDAAMAQLKARVVVDAFGFLGLMLGIILAQQAFAKPKARPVEELVAEEVARRMAAPVPPHSSTPAGTAWPTLAEPPTTPAPAILPTPRLAPSPTPPPATPPPPATAPPPATPSPRRTHCPSCGSVLVAGGRICPLGHAQA